MPAHMRVLPKPRKGTAKRARTARTRAKAATLKANAPKVLERDGWRCRVCARCPVHVHHIVFRSQGGTHETSNLVCLCWDCHRDVHEARLIVRGDADGRLFIKRVERPYTDAPEVCEA